MKTAVLLSVLLLSCFLSAGCNQAQLNVEQVALVSYGATYAASYTAVTLETRSHPEQTADISKIAEIISGTVLPSLTNLQATNDLYVNIYPILAAEIAGKIADARARTMALALLGQGLRVGELYLNAHPDIAKQKADWLQVVNALLRGAADGVRDATSLKAQKIACDLSSRRVCQ